MEIKELVKRCKNGDREAFGNLYRIYYPSMMKVVEYYVHNRYIAYDILHDGFIIAMDAISSLQEPTKFESWLTTIMRNLSLQYLRDSSNSVVANSELPDLAIENHAETLDLTWEELSEVIDRLPNGYKNVFNLAVLDGLSHKEIGELLGIAPHSSSSQLTHAKTMLRELISQYRIKKDIISIVSIILLSFIIRFINNNSQTTTPAGTNPIADITTDNILPDFNFDNSASESQPIHKIVVAADNREGEPLHADKDDKDIRNEKIDADIDCDGIDNDTLPHFIPRYNPEEHNATANSTRRVRKSSAKSDWSLALAYTGNSGVENRNRYLTNPDTGADADPMPEEITEKVNHHIPIVIGLSINKSITKRLSLETGLRYTLLRTDSIRSSLEKVEFAHQRIHYIGVPLKLSYRIYSARRLSIYTQGGGILDIPVSGLIHKYELIKEDNKPTSRKASLHAPIQWSLEAGIGIQYNFTPSLSIYAEPSMQYYFDNNSSIKTIRQDKPIEFTVPIGLRISW